MTEYEIRVKALEIAVLILGAPKNGGATKDGKIILDNYLFLAEAVEQHIRGTLKPEQADKGVSS